MRKSYVNKHYLFLFGIIIFSFCFSSCDKIEGPFREDILADTSACPVPAFPPGDGFRKVLLEDFTGHTCGNCPAGHEEADALKSSYGKKLIILDIHVGTYALPRHYPDSSFAYDFRTTAGTDLSDHFGNDIAGLPNGLVNRMTVNGSKIINTSAWSTVVADAFKKPMIADISTVNNLNDDTKILCSYAQVTFISNFSGTCKLALYLVEDSISNWQKDYRKTPQSIRHYMHRYALRQGMNGAFGEKIAEGNMSPGSKFIHYSKIKMNDEWTAEHCSVIAVLYDVSTEEIIQCEIKKVN